MGFEQIVQGGGMFTQGFGQTDYALSCGCEWSCPGYPPGAFHAGIDIAAARGSVLTAVGYGQVVRIGRSCPGCRCDGLGPFAVCVNSGDVDIWYGHAYQALVSVGDLVVPGQPLSLMDSMGCSTGDHVHYEVQPAGSVNGCAARDPWAYVSRWPGQAPAPAPAPPPDIQPTPVAAPGASSGTPWLLVAAGGAALLLATR